MQENVLRVDTADSGARALCSIVHTMDGAAMTEKELSAAAEPQAFPGMQAQAARDLEVAYTPPPPPRLLSAWP